MEIVPHAGGIESLFSQMSATKTKHRSRMRVALLKMLSQLHIALSKEGNKMKASKPITKRSKDTLVANTEDDWVDEPNDSPLFN